MAYPTIEYAQPGPDMGGPKKKKKKEEDQFDHAQANREAESFAIHETNQRIGAFSPGFVRTHPAVVAHIAFSSFETDKVQRLANGLSTAWPQLSSMMTFGLPADLYNAIASASRDPDPERARRRLKTIRTIQTLSPQERSTLDASVRAGIISGGQAPVFGGGQVTGEPGQEIGLSYGESKRVREKAAKAMGTNLDEVDSHLWDAYYAPILGLPGTSLENMEKHPLGSAIWTGASVALLAVPGLGELGAVGKGLAYGRAYVGFSAAQEPVSAGLKAGGQALEHVPGGHVLREVISKPIWVASEIGKGLAYPGALATRKILDAAGVSPSDPLYQDVESIGGFIGGWMLANIGGKSAAAIRMARRDPSELVQGAETPEAGKALRKQLGGPVAGRVAKQFYDVFSHPVSEWLRTGPGKRLTRHVLGTLDTDRAEASIRTDIAHTQDLLETARFEKAKVPLRRELADYRHQLALVGKDPAGLLVERFRGMPPELADAWAGAKSAAEVNLAYEDYINRLDEKGRVAARSRVKAIDRKLTTDLPSSEVTDLKAEKLILQRQLSFTGAEPLFKTPRTSILRRLQTATPNSKLAQKLYHLYDPKVALEGPKPVPHPAHLFDDMPNNVFYNPNRADAPANVLSHNAEVIIRVGRGFGMKESAIRGFVQRIAKGLPDSVIYKTFVQDWANAIRDTDAIAADIKERFAHHFEREIYERNYGTISYRDQHGGIGERNVRGGDNPSPSLTAHFVDHIRFPDLAEIREATSWTRSKLRPLEEARREAKEAGTRPPLKTAAVLPYQFVKSASAWSTAIFKPMALGAWGLRTPALWARIVGEEVVRAREFGNPVHFFKGYGKGLDETMLKDLGTFNQEMFQMIPSRTVYDTVESVGWSPGGREPPPEVWQGLWDQYMGWISSPEGRELATRGVEGYLKWSKDTPQGKYFRRQFAELSDEEFTQMAKENMAWLDQITSSHTEFGRKVKEAVATGQLRLADLPAATERRPSKLGEEGVDEYARLQRDDQELDGIIQEAYADGDTAMVRAWQDEQKTVRDRMKTLDREGDVKPRQSVSLGDDGDKFQAELKAAWQRGDFELPLKTPITKAEPLTGKINRANLVRGIVQNTGYRPVRWVGRSEVKRVRGGLWKSVMTKEERRLLSLGHTEEFASRHADVYARRMVSDIMYDLTARSSAHLFVKNVFWFAPAWQEVLTTWTVKIPSRMYWPVGVAYLAGKAGLVGNLMHDLGLLQKDRNGNFQTVIPGFNWFFDRLAGTPVAEIGSINPANLSFVTGSIGPGLSTPYSVAVAGLAKKYGGVFGQVSNSLQAYGAEQTVFPYAFNDIYALATGGKQNPLELASRDYQQVLRDKAFSGAMQDAAVQVGPAPKPPEKALLSGLSEKERLALEQKYKDDWDAWFVKLKSTARHVLFWHNAVLAFGHTIAPTSIRITTQEREHWMNFYSDQVLGGKSLSGPYTEHQTQLMNDFLSEFPDSVAYSVWQTEQGKPFRQLPFTPKDEDALWVKVYTGDRRALSPEEWAQKLSYTESHRLFTGRLQEALDAAGKTAPALLRNGFERQGALTKYKEDRAFYFSLHPQFEAELAARQNELLKIYTAEGLTFPLRSFEAQRLSDLKDLLSESAKYFLLDGHLDQDFRKVRSKIGQLFSEQANFPAPTTKVSEDIAWYYNNVMDPYWAKVKPWYDRARKAGDEGRSDLQSIAYDHIRSINNTYADISHGKQSYPAPEEVMYGNLSDADKETARLKWLSQPTTWLSDYQRKTAGYGKTTIDQKPLTVYVADPRLAALAQTAAQQWNKPLGVGAVHIVTDRSAANVVLDFGPHGEGMDNQGQAEEGGTEARRLERRGEQLWVHIAPSTWNQIQKDRKTGFYERPDVKKLMAQGRVPDQATSEAFVVTHEIGHVLGLDHSPFIVDPKHPERGKSLTQGIMGGGSWTPNAYELGLVRKRFGITKGLSGKNWDEFVKFQTDYDRKLAKIVADRGLSTSSKDYEALKAERDREVAGWAKHLGVGEMWKLSEAAPYERILKLYEPARTNPIFRQTVAAVQLVQNRIDNASYGHKRDTEVVMKDWLYGIMEDLTNPRSKNYRPEFAGIMKDLSYAVPPAGKDRRTGRLLFEALWFGNFNPSFIDKRVLGAA